MATAPAPNWNQEPHSRLRTWLGGHPLGNNGVGSVLTETLLQAPGQHLPRLVIGRTSIPNTRTLLEEAVP